MTDKYKNIKCDVEKVQIHNANIYSVYLHIKNSIKSLQRNLKKLYLELDRAIGGPQDVKAQVYDKVGGGAGYVEDIMVTYYQVVETSEAIDLLKYNLRGLIKSKEKVETTLKEACEYNDDNLELKVFVGHYIDNKSLKELSKEFQRVDSWGRKRNYSYQYLREINVKIKQKMEEDSKNLQNGIENLQHNVV